MPASALCCCMALARGEASDASDIDLVAIYDDLDYDERWKRRCALKARARAAAGCDVDEADAAADS